MGAVVGAAITVVVQVWLDRTRRREEVARLRSEVALAVIEWLQDTTQSVSMLVTHKTIANRRVDKPLLTDEEYRLLSHDLRRRMLHDALRARVAIVFGDGDELVLLNALQDGIRQVIRAAWATPIEQWPATQKWIEEKMQALDSTRNTLEQALIRAGRLPVSGGVSSLYRPTRQAARPVNHV